MIVGRGARCHVRIGENTVSTLHAKLLPPQAEGRPWRIVDNGSSNGTFVDGSPVTNSPVPLSIGAEVGFGSFAKFAFMDAEALLQILPPLHTIRAGPALKPTDRYSQAETGAFEFDKTAVVADASPEGGELLLMCNTLDPVALEIGKTVVVGRANDADLVLPDHTVSRRHAEFQRSADGVCVRDLGSSNGTFLGGVRLTDKWQALPLGKSVSIGKWDLYAGAPPSSTQILRAVPDRQ